MMTRDSRELLRSRFYEWGVRLLVCLGVLAFLIPAPFVDAYQCIMFQAAPSAERAFHYGESHFNAENPALYDIDKAEHYFEKALTLDPKYPNLQHEMARIEFLRGNFAQALARINLEIDTNPAVSPSSYYIRALILGFLGRYKESALDYERFLAAYPTNWAALNDYAWVLLKAGRFQDALRAADRGLAYFPNNPWLLNSKATALYELVRYTEALDAVSLAAREVENITEKDWLMAYPGNDPKIAREGILAFRAAVKSNMHTIQTKIASDAIQ